MYQNLTSFATKVDEIFIITIALSLLILIAITITMIVFVIKYNRKRHPEPVENPGNWKLELIWTIIPTIIVLVLFYLGWDTYISLRNVPPNALDVKVEGVMFSWNFTYQNGKQSKYLIVPQKRPVKLVLESRDVTHALFIPAFRIKIDVVPGMKTYTWFLPEQEDVYEIFCAEFCGSGHYDMTTKLFVVTPEAFLQWYNSKIDDSVILKKFKGQEGNFAKIPGFSVLKTHGCITCHSIDGSGSRAPTLKGLYGKKRIIQGDENDVEVIADDDYIRKAINDARSEIVKGYPPIMRSFKLTDREMTEILDYLKKLK